MGRPLPHSLLVVQQSKKDKLKALIWRGPLNLDYNHNVSLRPLEFLSSPLLHSFDAISHPFLFVSKIISQHRNRTESIKTIFLNLCIILSFNFHWWSSGNPKSKFCSLSKKQSCLRDNCARWVICHDHVHSQNYDHKGSHPLPNRKFFYTLCKGGRGGGGSNRCVKIYVANLYNSGGLLTT